MEVQLMRWQITPSNQQLAKLYIVNIKDHIYLYKVQTFINTMTENNMEIQLKLQDSDSASLVKQSIPLSLSEMCDIRSHSSSQGSKRDGQNVQMVLEAMNGLTTAVNSLRRMLYGLASTVNGLTTTVNGLTDRVNDMELNFLERQISSYQEEQSNQRQASQERPLNGRTRVTKEQKINTVRAILQKDITINDAARIVRRSRRTVNRWINEWEEQ